MDLADALRIRQGDVIAIVGGGGKTTAMYRLGVELARRNAPVLLSGTTRFTQPEGGDPPHLTMVQGSSDINDAIETGGTPLTIATGWGSKGRLLPVEPEWIDALHGDYPELTIVIEADGSAMRPFKAPNDREPVIPAGATIVVCVVGMDVVGRPLDEIHVHRPERVAGITGDSIGAPVTPEMVATALTHPAGGQKSIPAGARWIALLNKADTPSRRFAADSVARLLSPKATEVIIGQVKRNPPVLTVVR